MKPIAYQHRALPNTLRCLRHEPDHPGASLDWMPITAYFLTGIPRITCSYRGCGKNVLGVARELSRTPCSIPDGCEDGQLCDNHEIELAHLEGEHSMCGVTCETAFSSDMLRNSILYSAIPGSGNLLKELERRAAGEAGRLWQERERENGELFDKLMAAENERDRLRAELGIGAPWTCPVCGKENHRRVCLICETDRPDENEDATDEV